MNEHIKIHKHSSAFKCDICDIKYDTAESLKRHNSKDHKHFENLVCKICQKEFSSKHVLKQHIFNVHEKEGIVSCEFCQKQFSTRYNLNIHIKTIHENIKEHKCNQCGKAFASSNHLKKHSNAKCDECDKNFCKAKLIEHKHLKHGKDQMILSKYHSLEHKSSDYKTQAKNTDESKVSSANAQEPKKLKLSLVDLKHSVKTEPISESVKSPEPLEKILKCQYCAKVFKTSTYLQNHKGKRTTCQKCGEMFCTSADFKAHDVKRHKKLKSNVEVVDLEQQRSKKRFFNEAFAEPVSIKTRNNTIVVDELHKKVTNEDVEAFFQDQKLKSYLKQLASGKRHSQRHNLMKRGVKNFSITSEILTLGNITFLKDDGKIDNTLIKICKNIYDDIVREQLDDDSDYKSNYIKYVLIPEGIIYFLMDKFGIPYKVAEAIFVNTTNNDESADIHYEGQPEEPSVPIIKEVNITEDDEDMQYIPDLD